MEARAIAKYVRMSPMKVGVVLDLIRGKNVNEAFAILQYTPKDAAVVINKVLKSAVANAENRVIRRFEIVSTSDTPETAASPQVDTMTVSAIPISIDKNESAIRGIIKARRSRAENWCPFILSKDLHRM